MATSTAVGTPGDAAASASASWCRCTPTVRRGGTTASRASTRQQPERRVGTAAARPRSRSRRGRLSAADSRDAPFLAHTPPPAPTAADGRGGGSSTPRRRRRRRAAASTPARGSPPRRHPTAPIDAPRHPLTASARRARARRRAHAAARRAPLHDLGARATAPPRAAAHTQPSPPASPCAAVHGRAAEEQRLDRSAAERRAAAEASAAERRRTRRTPAAERRDERARPSRVAARSSSGASRGARWRVANFGERTRLLVGAGRRAPSLVGRARHDAACAAGEDARRRRATASSCARRRLERAPRRRGARAAPGARGLERASVRSRHRSRRSSSRAAPSALLDAPTRARPRLLLRGCSARCSSRSVAIRVHAARSAVPPADVCCAASRPAVTEAARAYSSSCSSRARDPRAPSLVASRARRLVSAVRLRKLRR